MQHKNQEYFQILERFVDDYISHFDRSPSTKEIANGTGLSNATVSRYLCYMRDHGMVDYDGIRNIRTSRMKKEAKEYAMVPVLGNVSCGIPRFAEGNITEYVRLPVSLLGQGDFYVLQAYGDSMTGAGIDDGDMVLIRQQDTADPGQIVVALMGEEATLKRLKYSRVWKRMYLHPENDAYDDIPVEEGMIIQGVAVKVLKNLV